MAANRRRLEHGLQAGDPLNLPASGTIIPLGRIRLGRPWAGLTISLFGDPNLVPSKAPTVRPATHSVTRIPDFQHRPRPRSLAPNSNLEAIVQDGDSNRFSHLTPPMLRLKSSKRLRGCTC
jgi:hypothetical protein